MAQSKSNSKHSFFLLLSGSPLINFWYLFLLLRINLIHNIHKHGLILGYFTTLTSKVTFTLPFWPQSKLPTLRIAGRCKLCRGMIWPQHFILHYFRPLDSFESTVQTLPHKAPTRRFFRSRIVSQILFKSGWTVFHGRNCHYIFNFTSLPSSCSKLHSV